MSNIGKLKRTLREKCFSCDKNLQERTREVKELVRGELYSHDESYIYCPHCQQETEIKSKRRKVFVEKVWDGKI